jgi:hypothetical protein
MLLKEVALYLTFHKRKENNTKNLVKMSKVQVRSQSLIHQFPLTCLTKLYVEASAHASFLFFSPSPIA